MKKFFKRFGKRITSIFLTVLIIIISCVYPFFSVSAIAAEVTLFALGSLIWTVAGGILTGSAFESAESVTSAVSDFFNQGLSENDPVCTAFSQDPLGTAGEFLKSCFPAIGAAAGLSSSFADADKVSSSIDSMITNKNGGISISAKSLSDMRAGLISSVNGGKDVTVTDDGYAICGDGSAVLNYGGTLYSATPYVLGTSYSLDDISSEFMDYTVSADFSKTLVAYTDEEILFLRGFRFYESVSYEKTYIEPFAYPNNFLGRNGKYDTSCTDFQLVIDGSFTATASFVLSHNGLKNISCNISSSFFDPITKATASISDSSKYSYVFVDDLPYSTVFSGNVTDISISDVQGGVISTVQFDGIEKVISSGQSIGIVDDNPTITFNPTTAADGTITIDTTIDDVPVAEIEKEISDKQTTIDDINGLTGAISGAFPDISIDVPAAYKPISLDTSQLVETLQEAVKAKFPVIDQCTALLNNLFNSPYNSDPPNFYFYWDSNGDGEKERYNALDLSFFETKLSNENLEDKSRFSTPITVRSLVQGFIILIFYVVFALKVIKLLPTVFGGTGEGVSDVISFMGDKK